MLKTVIPDRLIYRTHYLSAIEPFIDQPLVKVLVGQRRVGKSYMLYQLMNDIARKYPDAAQIYLNKEDLAFDTIKNAGDLNRYILDNTPEHKKTFVFIDEIQDIDFFEKTLRSLALQKNYDLYCTGNNAKMLSGELATLLSGRYIEFYIHSLSYSEFLEFHDLDADSGSLKKYLTFGGLPQLSRLGDDDEVRWEYLRNIVNTIVYKDVVMRYNVRNTRFLNRLIRFLADNTGSIFSAKRISDFLKSQKINISHNQVQIYTEYLCNAFLTYRLDRLDIIGRKMFEIGEKFYFTDTGIRNSIVGYKPEDIHKIIENAVCNHLQFCGYNVKTGQAGSLEIDFVAEKRNEKMYIQVAWRLDTLATIEREFGNLKRIPDNYPKMVITMDEKFANTSDGIRHLHLSEFLLNEW
ncbi:MAG: ATP-binding protein [bacterium]